MGASKSAALWFDFDHRFKLEFHGPMITYDAGILAYRELADAIGRRRELFRDRFAGHI